MPKIRQNAPEAIQVITGSVATSTPTTSKSPTAASPASTGFDKGVASTTTSPSTTTTSSRTAIFSTPALTTTFIPPPECTSQRLTMLESDAYRIWMNEPLPVPNTTFSDCYPSQFMTSYLEEKSNTDVPAFSPLVCPGNYHTVFQQSMSERPLYIACCPSGYELHPPDTSTPGRPAYGATCYSNIATVSVTQYDNSSSSGVTLFAQATGAQAYAHVIDGFALASSTTSSAVMTSTPPPNLGTNVNTGTMTTMQGPGTIIGIAIGGTIAVGMILTALFYCFRNRKRHPRSPEPMMDRHGSYWGAPGGRSSGSQSLADEKTMIVLPYGAEKASELPNGLGWVPELATAQHGVRYATHEVRELSTSPPSRRVSQTAPTPAAQPQTVHLAPAQLQLQVPPATYPPPPPRSPFRDARAMQRHVPTASSASLAPATSSTWGGTRPERPSPAPPLFSNPTRDSRGSNSSSQSNRLRRNDSKHTTGSNSTGISPPTSPAYMTDAAEISPVSPRHTGDKFDDLYVQTLRGSLGSARS